MIDVAQSVKTDSQVFDRRNGMLEIYGKEEIRWDECWNALPAPQRDAFARRCYYEALAASDETAKPECAVLKDHRGLVLHPYFRCPMTRYDWLDSPSGKYDLITAYGYGGFYGNVESTELVEDFMLAFNSYCKQTGVVAELVRLNPLIKIQPSIKRMYDLNKANSQVVVGLQRSDEEIMKSYLHNNRKNIKKALRSGVSIIREEIDGNRFRDFLEIYEDTMKRRSAKEAFLLPEDFYWRLKDGMDGMIQIFYSVLDGVSVSAELVLCSETAVYSFLGGTKEEYYEYRPNNLLKHEIIKWSRDNGFKYFLLGGGPQGNDGIFEYKRSFAPHGLVDFYIASRIYDQELYHHLITQCLSHPPQASEVAAAYPLRWRYAQKGLL